MIGARHTAGSTISKGGDSSPSNWVIVGRRRSRAADPGVVGSARKAEDYGCALLIIAGPMPSEKVRDPAGTSLNCGNDGRSLLLSLIAVEKWLGQPAGPCVHVLHPKFTLCRA